jgi:hypothetical protein
VRFLYEQVGQEETKDGAVEEVLTSKALAALPADWVADLYQAAIQADADLILDLLQRVREQHGPLADALASLVRGFRFDAIVALTQ